MQNVNKYGKLLLSAYIMKKMKKMKSGKSPGRRGTMRKYAKLAFGAYLLNKLRSGRLEKELKAEVKPEEMMLGEEEEEVETAKGRSSMRVGKVILGGLAGATLLYAVKRRAAKKRGHKIEVV